MVMPDAPAPIVAALWRYPVKSLGGEACDELRVGPNGVVGDRSFGIVDEASMTVLSAKREGRLLQASSSLASGDLCVRLPDGEEFAKGAALDAALTAWLERPVRLVEARQFGPGTYECPDDFEDDDSRLETWEGPSGSFVDESALHLLTTGDLTSLASERPDLVWDVRRFRPNVVAASAATSFEVLAPGRRVTLGELEVSLDKGCSRCVMTTRPQPGGLERQLDVLRHVAAHHDGNVGVRASVRRPGVVRVGDPVVSATSPSP